MADPNPKPNCPPSTTPLTSASSSSTTATPMPEKRTRDQPNLSDCHCCGRRINHTNPNDRLQMLTSVWRVVLLCRKCRKSVISGQTCPYCFRQTGNSGNIVVCCVCGRNIHEDCVKDYGKCTPWCYLGVGLGEFRNCVDCWVPNSLKTSVRVSENKGVIKGDNGDVKGRLDKLVKKAKFAEGKVNKRDKCKEQGLKKSVGSKRALHLGNGGLQLAATAKNDKDGKKGENSDSGNAAEIVGGSKPAIQLRRVNKSSSRVSKCNRSLSPIDLAVARIRNWDGISYKRRGVGSNQSKRQKMCAQGLENDNWSKENGPCCDVTGSKPRVLTYKRDKKRKIWQLDDEIPTVSMSSPIQPEVSKFDLHSGDARTSDVSDVSMELLRDPHVDMDSYGLETSISVNADQTSSCINVIRFGQNFLTYKRTRSRRKGQLCGQVGTPGEFHCCANQRLADRLDYSQPDDANHINHDTEEILPKEGCNEKQGRYSLKYVRRLAITKSYLSRLISDSFLSEDQVSAPVLSDSGVDSSVKSNDKSCLPNGSSTVGLDRYCIKYARKMRSSKFGSDFGTKQRSDFVQNECAASTPGLTMDSSAESRSSHISFDSLTFDPTK